MQEAQAEARRPIRTNAQQGPERLHFQGSPQPISPCFWNGMRVNLLRGHVRDEQAR
jgi:hypothetical protein